MMAESTPLLGNVALPLTYNSANSAVISLPVTSKNRLLINGKWSSLKAVFQLLLLFIAATLIVYLVREMYLPPLNE